MAKPRVNLTEKEKRLILAFYEMGKTDKDVADAMGLPRTTWLGILEYNGLTDAIKRRKGTADMKVEASLYGQAISGNIGAISIWLFNRQKELWKTVQRIHLTVDEQERTIDRLSKEEIEELHAAIKD